MELGLYTFGERTDPSLTVEARMAEVLEEIALADEVGLDVFGVGEHHRPDFTIAAPAVVLAAAAARTRRHERGPCCVIVTPPAAGVSCSRRP